jgi:hypothetical protein
LQLNLIETITGIYAVDEKNNIIAKQFWPKEPRTGKGTVA